MSQPMDRNSRLPALGQIDAEAGEFWVENPFLMPKRGDNLSAYERNCLFLNTSTPGQPRFLDASFASNTDLDSDSRSAIAADFDLDGDLDLLVGSVGGGPLRLFENRIAQGHRILVELQGTRTNRNGIGCRITVETNTKTIVRDVFPASGFMGVGTEQQNIGLGQDTRIRQLTVRWTDGSTQQFQNLDADHRYQITQDSMTLQSLPLKKSTTPVAPTQ